MRAAFRYLGRGSWLSRRDPRVLVVVPLLFVVGASQLRDARHLALACAIGLGYYSLARIPWRAVRGQWIFLLAIISFVSITNALITGGRTSSFANAETHVLFVIPLIGAEVSAEGISLALSQILRYAAMAAVGIPVAYALAPGDLGVALRHLRIGDRIAVMVDLTVRFIPTLAGEFSDTIDAQRVRGYDPTERKGGPITRLRRFAPVFVPVTIGAIAGAEDTIDAMDLRGFGSGPRTWLRDLRFRPIDWLVVGVCMAFVVISTVANVTGSSPHYLLPFLLGD